MDAHQHLASERGAPARFARYRLPQNVAAGERVVVIKDDRGQAAFEIDGGVQASDNVIRVRSRSDGTTCSIQGGGLLAGDSVEIVDLDEQRLARIERIALSPVRERFSIVVGRETVWTVAGNVASYAYRIRAGDGEVAEVSRRWFRARDSFGVQIADARNHLLALSVVVCLDLMMHAGK